jgi:PAS domain S-box-containing protein
LPQRKSSADGFAELHELRRELERLARENAELRARASLDEQLDSDASRYRMIVASLAEGIVLQSAEGQILACNAAAQRILGLSVDQMLGRTSLDPRWRAVHEDGTAFLGETHPAMVSLRTGRALHDVVMGVHKPDGVLTWISIDSQPLFKPGRDRPYAVVASFVDITTHKQSEARARDSEEKLRVALHAANMGTWEWDIASGRVLWSEKVELLFGLEPGTFGNRYDEFLAFVHPADREGVEATVQGTLARDPGAEGSDDFILEYRVRSPDGTIRWLASFGRLIRDERGEPVKMAGTAADISSRKSLEEQLLLSQRMETVGRLAGGVAHDFNNMLTAILGCAELVEGRTRHDPVAGDALDIIREAAEKAAGLTRRLLSFARKQVFNLELIDLRELVANTERLLSRIIGENIRIHVQLGELEILIRADRAQVEQVLINLAVNARDAMPHGGSLHIEVGIASLSTGDWALLRVRDSGEGISEATLPHIFDPFFTTRHNGTGLGLSTCYGIVKQLGGDIVVDSEPGKGTRFTIHLPFADERVDDSPEGTRPSSVRRQGRILLAEDEAVVRQIAERGLQALGYEVFAASDGLAALELVDAGLGEIDLLLTDIVMPNMTGYQLAEQLRSRQPDLKVLFVSGYDDALDRDGSPHGVEGASYLPKPYTVSRLADAVGQMLGR